MKTGLVLFFLCALFSFNSFGQKATYCHQTIRLGYLDEVQLISNISSRHHLMVLGPKKTPVLHVFDESLKLLDIKELPVTIPGKCDIEILTFKNHYFLFTHQPKTSNYQLWKIDDRGNATDLSPFFYKLANSFFLDSNATVQINVDSNNFYLRTQVYYPAHNRLQISLIRADPMLNVLASDRINIPFDKENEQLQQLLILDEEHLLILKQLRNDVAENLLVVVKCNLKSGKMTATQFNLHYSLFSQPALYYNAVDSSIFIYAMVRESLMSQGNKRSVFMCKMNDSLEVVEPATLLKSPNLFSFFLVKDVKPDWIHFFDFRLGYHNWRVMSNWSSGRYYKQELYPYMDNNLPAIRGSGYFSETNGRNTNKVRFAVVDQQFKILSDSALLIDDKAFSIRVSNFGKIQWKNQSYIIMEQQLPRKNTGLLLITYNKNILEITDLPVYNRYRYLLSQLQQARDESVIIPYIDKDKVGLMRLKMN